MPLFYRIVLTNPPTLVDFMSHVAKGRLPREDAPPEVRRSYVGVSAFSAEAAARAMALRRPYLGAFLAVLDVPEGAGIEYAQMGKNPEHYDLYGSPELLMGYLRAVIPV